MFSLSLDHPVYIMYTCIYNNNSNCHSTVVVVFTLWGDISGLFELFQISELKESHEQTIAKNQEDHKSSLKAQISEHDSILQGMKQF